MNDNIPRRVAVDGKQIADLVFGTILPPLHGTKTDVMVLSLICAAAIAMRPDCPTEKLQQVIMDVSGHLVMQLQDPVAPGDAN